MRQALEEIQDALGDAAEGVLFQAAITRWFGLRSDDSDFNNQRGTLFFGDFVHPHPRPEDQLLSRIKIDQETGAVERRMLLVADTPFAYGEPVVFRGEIRCVTGDEAQAGKATSSGWRGTAVDDAARGLAHDRLRAGRLRAPRGCRPDGAGSST